MVKRILFSILFLAFVLCSCFAKSGEEHNKDICGLFYDSFYAKDILDSSLYMQSVCSATFMALDYNSNKNYRAKGQEAMNSIERIGVSFPFSMTDLHCVGDGGSDHEKYTHMGWQPYYSYSEDVFEKWLLRKEILLKLVVKVFDFSSSDEALCLSKLSIEKKYNKEKLAMGKLVFFDTISYGIRESKSYSFAAILYYTHILGDIIFNSEGTSRTRIALSDLCKELKHHLEVVFGNKLKKGVGKELLYLLDEASRPDMILQYLQSTLQELLPKESFFKNSSLATEIKKCVWEV